MDVFESLSTDVLDKFQVVRRQGIGSEIKLGVGYQRAARIRLFMCLNDGGMHGPRVSLESGSAEIRSLRMERLGLGLNYI